MSDLPPLVWFIMTGQNVKLSCRAAPASTPTVQEKGSRSTPAPCYANSDGPITVLPNYTWQYCFVQQSKMVRLALAFSLYSDN
jgi:hypothetical protein